LATEIKVFEKAVEQILDKSLGLQKGVDYSKTPKFYGARPVAFIGVHAQMIGRKSIGFLLTSRHLLVKFDASAVNVDEVAAAFRLGKYLQNELETLAWQELEKCEFEIEDEMKAAMKMRTISHKRFLSALMFPLHIRFLRYGYAGLCEKRRA